MQPIATYIGGLQIPLVLIASWLRLWYLKMDKAQPSSLEETAKFMSAVPLKTVAIILLLSR
ncbi:hypothetical protein D3C85_1392190 [compost metagenome]